MRKVRTITINTFFLLCISSLTASADPIADDRVYTVGVVPQQTPSKLAKTWTPILRQLSADTGYKLRFRTAKDIPAFEQRLAKGLYDIAYMNPSHYTYFHEVSGYNAFAKAKDKKIQGIIVVNKDSDITTIEQLKDLTIAFPSPGAFAASILPRTILAEMNISHKAEYVYSHDSVYSNIALGRYKAGGGVMRTYKATNAKVKKALRILYTTKQYTPHAFAAHKHIPDTVVKKIQAALVNLDKTEKGKKYLKRLRIKGVEKAENTDWDDVRKLNIKYRK